MVKLKVLKRNESGEMETVDSKPLVLTEELVSLIGRASEPITYEIERGAIKRYAEAIEDFNPLYRDLEYARNSGYPDLVCPPGFFGFLVEAERHPIQGLIFNEIITRTGRSTIMDNGGELQFMQPVCAGDVLVAVTRVADIFEEIGRSGRRLLLVIHETTYTNQSGEVVAAERSRVVFP